MKEVIISSTSEFIRHLESLGNLGNYWFRGVARTSYLPVPSIVWKKIKQEEGPLAHGFLVSYKSYINDSNLNDWELFALMQHHGMPTRLLDWSESALVALYFALTLEPDYDGYRAVWVLEPYELNEKTIGFKRLFCPAIMRASEIRNDEHSINLNSYLPPNLKSAEAGKLPEKPAAINATQHIKRVSSQKGCFTVHGTSDETINTYLDNPDHFHMIKIDSRSKESRNIMIDTLAALGINGEHIYQDLDSLCRNIKRKRNIDL